MPGDCAALQHHLAFLAVQDMFAWQGGGGGGTGFWWVKAGLQPCSPHKCDRVRKVMCVWLIGLVPSFTQD
jgi:hypothetical protein